MSLMVRSAEVLAQTVAHALLEEGRVFGLTEAELASVVRRVIEEDRRLEEEVNAAAKELMQQHAGEISRQSMDTGILFQKFRAQIAKQRGFVL